MEVGEGITQSTLHRTVVIRLLALLLFVLLSILKCTLKSYIAIKANIKDF